MPIKREKTYAAAIDSLSELLVALQLDGHLDGASLPGWAIGTSVSEAFDALNMLGDGAWLDGVYEDLGEQESADRWFSDFLKGKAVPTPADVASRQDEDDEANSSVSADSSLESYLVKRPLKQRASLQKRLQDAEFKERALKLVKSAGEVMAGAYCVDDKEFEGLVKSAQCLASEYLADADLAEMARFHIVDARDTVLNILHEMFGGDLGRAIRRAEGLGSQLTKVIAKSSKPAKVPTTAKPVKAEKVPTPAKATRTAKTATTAKSIKSTSTAKGAKRK